MLTKFELVTYLSLFNIILLENYGPETIIEVANSINQQKRF